LRHKIKKWFHGILMPRGKNFVYNPELEQAWIHIDVISHSKTISTIYKIVDNQAPTVILCHPYLAESRQFFLKRGHADMYLEMGLNVVIFDFNGFGHSPFVNFHYHEDLDLVARYFKTNFSFTSFICHGVSFGASQVITYTSQASHLIDKIIIENCLDSNLSYYKKRNSKLYNMMRLLMVVLPNVNKNHDYIKAAAKIHSVSKSLLIYNSEDDLTTVEMGNKIKNALTIPTEMSIFAGKHLEAYDKNKNNYIKVINAFVS